MIQGLRVDARFTPDLTQTGAIMDTGRKILNLRRDIGLPQKMLAEQSSVTPSALSRIETGLHQPRGPITLRLSRYLGVTADYLLDETAPYPPPAREVLSNLEPKHPEEPRNERMRVSAREKALVDAFRDLDEERRVFLQALLDAPRDRLRSAAVMLGAGEELPGLDQWEVDRVREQIAAETAGVQ